MTVQRQKGSSKVPVWKSGKLRCSCCSRLQRAGHLLADHLCCSCHRRHPFTEARLHVLVKPLHTDVVDSCGPPMHGWPQMMAMVAGKDKIICQRAVTSAAAVTSISLLAGWLTDMSSAHAAVKHGWRLYPTYAWLATNYGYGGRHCTMLPHHLLHL